MKKNRRKRETLRQRTHLQRVIERVADGQLAQGGGEDAGWEGVVIATVEVEVDEGGGEDVEGEGLVEEAEAEVQQRGGEDVRV